MPVSDEGDSAHEARACDKACCRVVCIFRSRDRLAGNGVACFSLAGLRLTVDGGGVGSLESNEMVIRFLPQIYLLDAKRVCIPSPNPFRRKRDRFVSTWGSTPFLTWRYTQRGVNVRHT